MTSKVDTPSKITDYFPPSPKSEDAIAGAKSTGCAADRVDEVSTALPDCVPDKLTKTLSGSSLLITPKASPSKDESTVDQSKATDDQTRATGHQTRATDDQTKATNDQTRATGHQTRATDDQTKATNDQTRATGHQTKAALSVEKTEPETVIDSASVGTKSDKYEEVKTQTTKPPKSRRKGRKKEAAQGKTQNTTVTNGPANPKSAKTKSSLKDTLVTDYFPVRRSERRNKSEIEKEKEQTLQYNLVNGVEDGLKVEDINNKGRGVVATKPFKRGDFVVEYAGDLIDIPEAKKRDEKYSKDPTKGCYMYYFNLRNKNYCIDATAESGKLGRLLNHSKTAGNCHTKLVECGGRPYLILVASTDIAIGDELQYDYGDRSSSSIKAHPWLKS